MTNRKFIDSLAAIPTFIGDKERQVEQAYNTMLIDAFPGIQISNPYKCDGYFETEIGGKKTGVIMEYKYNLDFSSKTVRSGVLAQVMFYLKKFEKDGKPFPAVVLIGDVNECFVIHSNHLLKFLDIEGVDWSVAPSSASSQTELVLALASDENRNAFVYDIVDGFDFSNVVKQIEDCATNVVRLIHITEHNVDSVFKLFCDKVVKSSMSPNDLVGLFLGCIVDSANNYLHPKKKGVLVTPNGEVKVNHGNFLALISHFDTENVSPIEKKRLSEICDRLIEDTTRRKKGEFYTPTAFVDYAHARIEKVLGENWKDEYVVWDCCCGTKNLTRDYRFKELYCSTLEKSELDISEKYNPEAVSFQFDFLNDDFEKLPEGLKDAFRNKKKIVFLMNPPYATACNLSTKDGISKGQKSCETKVTIEMNKIGFGNASNNLFAQFLYRCEKLKKDFGVDVSLAFFCNPIYLSGPMYSKFRKQFLHDFKYEDGFLFNAGHFSDVSMNWGINFSIWTSGETLDKNNFKHDLVDTDESGEISIIGDKDIYNSDGFVQMKLWIKEDIGNLDLVDMPKLSSAILCKETKYGNKLDKNAIGCYSNGSNNVAASTQGVAIFTSLDTSNGNGLSILPSNFLRCTCAFTARKLVESNWINQKDEYLAPDTTNPNFHQFEMDSVIYSLFHSSSQQSSLRQIDYKGKKWDIPNHFFWMSRNEIMNLANENNNDDAYNDARMSEDRFVYKFIQSHLNEFSPEAKAVLDKGSELVRKSFKYRFLFDQDHPEYQVNNWDCGFYQLKQIWKEYLKDDFNEFKELYKAFSQKMLPQVYELGFLKK